MSPTVAFEVNAAETPGRTHTIALEVLPLDFHVFLPVISVGRPHLSQADFVLRLAR
jgi:hypothetical protein